MACKIANKSCGVAPIAFNAFTTSANETALGINNTLPGSWLISICETAVDTVVPLDKGAGWLITGEVLMTTDRLPCDTAQVSKVTAWFITTEPVRAFKITIALPFAGVTLIDSSLPKKATRSSILAGVCTRITRPFSGVAVLLPKRKLIASATMLAVEKSDSFSSTFIAPAWAIGLG